MSVEPFRGSAAVAAGLVTPGQLRRARFRRLSADGQVPVVPQGTDPPDLELRSRAAYLLVADRGLGGLVATEILDASAVPRQPTSRGSCRAGRSARSAGCASGGARCRPTRSTTWAASGAPAPSGRRSACACACPPVEGIVAVDALARVGGFVPEEQFAVRNRHLGARGSCRVPEVVQRADDRSGSPIETRIRLAIEDEGLPVPVLPHPVGPYSLDLSSPAVLLANEHNGSDHLAAARALRDLQREAGVGTPRGRHPAGCRPRVDVLGGAGLRSPCRPCRRSGRRPERRSSPACRR